MRISLLAWQPSINIYKYRTREEQCTSKRTLVEFNRKDRSLIIEKKFNAKVLILLFNGL